MSFLLVASTSLSCQRFANRVETLEVSSLLRPPYLKAGDTVAMVAPSGIVKASRKPSINKAIAFLHSLGLEVEIAPHIYVANGHFAGTDSQRISDLQWALDAPHIKAIWCVRGGYGSVRLLDKLHYKTFLKRPKWVIGYSDITALHNQIHKLGVESIHALMAVSFEAEKTAIKNATNSFKKALMGESLQYYTQPSKYNRYGVASGLLVGGNLTLLHTMLGSKTSLDTKNKILFIEETGEYAYHIDRMLWSLKRAGYFDACKALVVGDFDKVKKNTTPFGKNISEIILEITKEYNFPVLFNFPAGHKDDNRAMILGRNIELVVKEEGGSVIFKTE